MPNDAVVNDKDKPAKSSQPTSASTSPKKPTPFTVRIGALGLLLVAFVLVVALALYLGSRQSSANTARQAWSDCGVVRVSAAALS